MKKQIRLYNVLFPNRALAVFPACLLTRPGGQAEGDIRLQLKIVA